VLGDNGPLAAPYTQISVGLDGTISITAQGQGPETLAQVGRISRIPIRSSSRSDPTARAADRRR
jgi:flagellar basal body rod protein FlgF